MSYDLHIPRNINCAFSDHILFSFVPSTVFSPLRPPSLFYEIIIQMSLSLIAAQTCLSLGQWPPRSGWNAAFCGPWRGGRRRPDAAGTASRARPRGPVTGRRSTPTSASSCSPCHWRLQDLRARKNCGVTTKSCWVSTYSFLVVAQIISRKLTISIMALLWSSYGNKLVVLIPYSRR